MNTCMRFRASPLLRLGVAQVTLLEIVCFVIALTSFGCSDDKNSTRFWTIPAKDRRVARSVLCLFTRRNGDVVLSTISGTYISSDHGVTWSAKIAGIEPNHYITRFAESPSGTLYASEDLTVPYYYDDSLSRWVKMNSPGGVSHTSALFWGLDQTLYVGGGTKLYSTSDNGDHYQLRYGHTARINYFIQDRKGRFYFATDSGLSILDETLSIRTSPAEIRGRVPICTIFTDGADHIYAAVDHWRSSNGAGLWASSDGGNSWVHLAARLPIQSGIAFPWGTIFAGHQGIFPTVSESNDFGNTWHDASPDDPSDCESSTKSFTLDSAGYLYCGRLYHDLQRSREPLRW